MKFVRACVRVDVCWKEAVLIVKFLFETGWKLLLLLYFFLSESCIQMGDFDVIFDDQSIST